MKFAVRRRFILVALIGAAWLDAGRVIDAEAQHRRSRETATEFHVTPATTARVRLAALGKRVDAMSMSPLRDLPLRSVGPAVMGGRVVDVEVSPLDPTVFYVAYATGGLWKTESNGTAFDPLFDHAPVAGIGDVAVRWGDPEVVYVGTGESNSSRSVVAGAGIYRSRDHGEHWDYLGLAETHGIGKVLLSPVDSNVVFVAALGHLYSKNPERGVYKTSDGGETWRATLQIDDSTGVVDLIMDPHDPDVLYAAAWHRSRKAWDFVEGGSSSGIYRSDDGGENWTLLSTKDSGFPGGDHVGRIGLAASHSSPETLYAVVDNQTVIERMKDLPPLAFDSLRAMTPEALLEVPEEDLQAFLDHYGFPDEYDAVEVRRQVEAGEIEPVDVAEWVGESSRKAYDTDVVGCEVYRSDDGGSHWERRNEKRLANVCETYGYYFGRIAVDPLDAEKIFVAGVPLLRSADGGRTFENVGRDNVHLDHHVVWVDPRRPGHLISGNDGGLNLSYDDGETWFKLNTPPVGQFYTVNFDLADPYNVYGGLQDNGVWYGPSTYEASVEWQAEGAYPYRRLLGGDGMMVEVSRSDFNIVYAGEQFGDYYRLKKVPPEEVSIRPYHRFGEEPLRFNWLTPIHLSTHNDQILYIGSQRMHRSLDGGDTWQDISDDLTMGARDGDVPFGTLTALDESPLRFGVLYAGSDDGLIHVSKDGGATWTLISKDLPAHMWVSRIETSAHVLERVYATLNGSRWDVMDSMVYSSEDYGRSWHRIGRDLPAEPVNVIREDPENEDVLYVGTDAGLYISLDRGEHFWPASADLPVVPVHDLRIQPRAHELLVATHGRSLYAGDVSTVERLDESIMASPVFAFEPDTVWFDVDWGNSDPAWEAPEVPDVLFAFWSAQGGSAALVVADAYGDDLITHRMSAHRGLNYLRGSLAVGAAEFEDYLERREQEGLPADPATVEPRDDGKRYLPPGSYDVRITVNSKISTTQLVVAE